MVSAFGAQVSGAPVQIAGWNAGDPANQADGLPATLTRLGILSGVYPAPDGSLLVTVDGRVRQIGTDGRVRTLIQDEYLSSYGKLAVNPQGDIYYSTYIGINKVTAASYANGPTSVYQRIAGIGNILPAEGAPAVNALLSLQGLTLDPSGNVLFSDAGSHSVWRIDSTGLLRRVAGTGTSGTAGVGGPAVSAQLQFPMDLAYDGAGTLYILDGDRVVKVAPDGTTSAAPLSPQGSSMAVDAAGNVYYASEGQFQIFRVGAAGSAPIAGTGDYGYSNGCGSSARPDVGDAITAQLGEIVSIALDSSGNLLAADSAYMIVRRIAPSGEIRTIAGKPSSFSGDGGPASAATMATPRGLAYDRSGNLYIADTGKHRVMKQAPDGTLTRFAGTGTAGFQLSPIGTAADSIPLSSPRAVGVDRNGNVYVGDDAMRTLKISPAGAIVDVFPRVRARSFSTDRQGNLYLTAAFIAYLVNDDDTLPPLAGRGQGPTINLTPVPPVEEPSANDLYTGSGLTRDLQGTLYNIAPGSLDLISAACTVVQLPYSTGFMPSSGPAQVAESPQGDVYAADSSASVVWRLPHLVPEAGDAPTPALAWGAPVRNAGSQLVATVDSTVPIGGFNSTTMRDLVSDPIAPGEIVRITGPCLGPYQTALAAFDSSGTLPFTLGGVQVNIGGLPAPLIAAQQGGITAIVPLGVLPGSAPLLTVTYGGAVAQETEQVAAFQPGLFRFLELDGSASAAAINQDGTINSPTNPAPPKSIVALYATGLGTTTPPGTDGRPIDNLSAKYMASVQVTVNGLQAAVLYAGPAPGFAGLSQINAVIPQTGAGAGTVQVLIGTAPFLQPVQVWVK